MCGGTQVGSKDFASPLSGLVLWSWPMPPPSEVESHLVSSWLGKMRSNQNCTSGFTQSKGSDSYSY